MTEIVKLLMIINLWGNRWISISYHVTDKKYGFKLKPKRKEYGCWFAACLFIPLFKVKNGYSSIGFNYQTPK